MSGKPSKSRSKKSSSQAPTPLMIGLLAVVLLIGVIFFGVEGGLQFFQQVTGIDLGVPTPAAEATAAPQPGSTPAVVEPGGGRADIQVYFTNPQPDVLSGGVENNLIALIDGATTSIDAAMFEFNLQNVADALIAAHQRGVRVRLVYDDEHTEEDPQMEEVIAAGIPATPDERSAFMHNKFYVIDGTTVWTGSTNITENDVYFNNNNVIVIRSPQLAANYTAEFEQMFGGTFGPSKAEVKPAAQIDLGGVLVENYFAPEEDVIGPVIRAVSSAQQSIHFMAFAFTQDDLGQAMLERARAGVEVRGIFEQRGSNTEFSECPIMRREGLDVVLDGNPRTFHHKVIIIDGQIAIMGSFNFSANAVESNDENLLIVHDPQIAALYEEEFQRRMAESKPVQATSCEEQE